MAATSSREAAGQDSTSGDAGVRPKTRVRASAPLSWPRVGVEVPISLAGIGQTGCVYGEPRRTTCDYLRARYYDPSTAQFLTRDPLTSMTRQPYTYVQDNPLNGTDPSGLDCGWTSPWDCPGQAVGWVVDHSHEIGQVANDISTVAGGIAAIAAPIPVVGEVVTPIAGGISLATGGVGLAADSIAAGTGHGDWSSVGLDALGLATGFAGKGIAGAAEGLGLSKYAGNIVEGTLFGVKGFAIGLPGLLHDLFGLGASDATAASLFSGCSYTP